MLEKAVVLWSGGKDAALALYRGALRTAGRGARGLPSDTVPIPAVCSNMDYEARPSRKPLSTPIRR